MVSLEEHLEKVATEMFGMTKGEALYKGICICCKNKIVLDTKTRPTFPGQIYSVAGENEYRVSGFCEYCFDAAFGM